jgi:acyl-CoA reductase-like NAD-dependent aldehyde dehydrogenase
MVILDDADLEAAADATLVSAFLCAGQSCTAGERFLVHEDVYDAFLDELNAAIARSIQLGDPFDPDTTLGPLNNEPTAQKMDRHVSDALERGPNSSAAVPGLRVSRPGFTTSRPC